MMASEVGSEDWWTVVRSMPPYEALQCLNDYKAGLLASNCGTSSQLSAQVELARVNPEIKRINRLIDDSNWRRALREVLTADQADAVIEYKRQVEWESLGRCHD